MPSSIFRSRGDRVAENVRKHDAGEQDHQRSEMVTVDVRAERYSSGSRVKAVDRVGAGEPLDDPEKCHRAAEDRDRGDELAKPLFGIDEGQRRREEKYVAREADDEDAGRISVERQGVGRSGAERIGRNAGAADREKLKQGKCEKRDERVEKRVSIEGEFPRPPGTCGPDNAEDGKQRTDQHERERGRTAVCERRRDGDDASMTNSVRLPREPSLTAVRLLHLRFLCPLSSITSNALRRQKSSNQTLPVTVQAGGVQFSRTRRTVTPSRPAGTVKIIVPEFHCLSATSGSDTARRSDPATTSHRSTDADLISERYPNVS